MQMIPYATLRQQLGIDNIRQLEDFVIGECFYAGIIKGKLDQHKQCLHVHDAISRDIRREELVSILQGLRNWYASWPALPPGITQKSMPDLMG